jgi:CheY-like chemotaxis protein
MEPTPETNRPAENGAEPISHATSELNNLLQIIAGTSSVLENIWEGTTGSEKYLAMLRASIERAEKVTAELAHHAGGCEEKTLVNPEIAGFVKTKNGQGSGAPRQNILVVDDEEMALILMKRVLSDAGFRVVTAQSGFDCLDLFRSRPHSFDLVLLDLTMPFMNGEETFARLHQIRPDVPIVLCTGFIDQERLNRMLRAGLSGFLRKPIASGEIVSNVRSILEGARFVGTGVPSGISATG